MPSIREHPVGHLRFAAGTKGSPALPQTYLEALAHLARNVRDAQLAHVGLMLTAAHPLLDLQPGLVTSTAWAGLEAEHFEGVVSLLLEKTGLRTNLPREFADPTLIAAHTGRREDTPDLDRAFGALKVLQLGPKDNLNLVALYVAALQAALNISPAGLLVETATAFAFRGRVSLLIASAWKNESCYASFSRQLRVFPNTDGRRLPAARRTMKLPVVDLHIGAENLRFPS
ncbi:MAG: hypothetical protein JWN01_56 [Patescibacteria group bacterium]|nr:hypothetical protein [Patescibacteria group bacterium]